MANKMLNQDGTISTFDGTPTNFGVQQWLNAQALPNKVLNPDGSIGTFDFGSGGGGTGTNGLNAYVHIRWGTS